MDTRIIAATNKNLADEIAKGNFREDLFYRINVINVHLPSLRERMDDFPLLVNHFILHFNRHFNKSIKQFSSSAYELLTEYTWRGNIRELENVIEHCFILCSGETIQLEHLPKRLQLKPDEKPKEQSTASLSNFKEAEREIIVSILNKHNGNRSKTAKELGIDTSTLWRKMKKLRVE